MWVALRRFSSETAGSGRCGGVPSRQAPTMETLLREIETQLAHMTAAQRQSTTAALADIVRAAGGMKDLNLSKKTVLRALQVMGIGMAQNKGMRQHLEDARKLAPRIGKHVEALVSAL